MTSKTNQPETIRQAEEHGQIIRNAERAGLCVKCAVQFANGVQLGFGADAIPAPCDPCTAILTRYDIDRGRGWRKPAGRLASRDAWKVTE